MLCYTNREAEFGVIGLGFCVLLLSMVLPEEARYSKVTAAFVAF